MPEARKSRYLHWVVLETGGNQRFIFDSNRLRHVKGGSQLLFEALSTDTDQCPLKPVLDGVSVVQSMSGKALLLVEDADRGRELIRRVSAWALRAAPGLEVTGAVGLPFNPHLPWHPGMPYPPEYPLPDDPERLDHVVALYDTFRRQRLARSARPAQQLRFRGLPWHLPCHETGLPAAGFERYGPADRQPVSDTAIARTGGARDRADRRLTKLLGGRLEPPDIIDDLTPDGWIAVVHADGNQVGALMSDFPRLAARALAAGGDALENGLTLEDHIRYLRGVSTELNIATREAFTGAVTAVLTGGKLPSDRPVLPVVVGGDDVTFICHADLALRITREFLFRFAQGTAEAPHLAALSQAYHPGGRGLTAAAGIAFVKRHHPFAYAVHLAEELTVSAKQGTRPPSPGERASTTPDVPDASTTTGLGVSAYDVHVAHETTLCPLSEMRAARGRDGVSGHAGPFVVGGPGTLPPHLESRHENQLFDVVELLTSPVLSASRAHDLRDAFDRGIDAYRQRLRVAISASATSDALGSRGELLEVRHSPTLPMQTNDGSQVDGNETSRGFLLLPDALLLHGVSRHQFPTRAARTTEASA